MADPKELLGLAARCEAATGPDAELDARIRCALWVPGGHVEQSAINGAWCVYRGTEARSGRPSLVDRAQGVSHETWRGAYTASLDSAMTLVTPVVASWGVLSFQQSETGFKAFVGVHVGQAATPALALTAASLRALANGDSRP
jgi:hypothetical protein